MMVVLVDVSTIYTLKDGDVSVLVDTTAYFTSGQSLNPLLSVLQVIPTDHAEPDPAFTVAVVLPDWNTSLESISHCASIVPPMEGDSLLFVWSPALPSPLVYEYPKCMSHPDWAAELQVAQMNIESCPTGVVNPRPDVHATSVSSVNPVQEETVEYVFPLIMLDQFGLVSANTLPARPLPYVDMLYLMFVHPLVPHSLIVMHSAESVSTIATWRICCSSVTMVPGGVHGLLQLAHSAKEEFKNKIRTTRNMHRKRLLFDRKIAVAPEGYLTRLIRNAMHECASISAPISACGDKVEVLAC